ncbi:MAG: choice-of-anchor J domain-containing protein [Bacteroidota bacterium]
MKKIYVLLIVILIGKLSYSQFIYQEDFSSGSIPSTFTLYTDTQTTNYSNFQNKAWIVGKYDPIDTGDFVAATTSYFAYGAFTADRWMITPSIAIPTGSSASLGWKSKNYNLNERDNLQVMLSTTGVNKTDFTTTLFNGADDTSWTNHVYPLAAYAGQNIYLAFVDQSTNKFILILDDIQVGESVGINETTNDKVFVNVYPNPASNYINIKTNNNIKKLKLFNALGQVVLTNENKSKSISLNISQLKQGFYTLSIETERGISVQKINVVK